MTATSTSGHGHRHIPQQVPAFKMTWAQRERLADAITRGVLDGVLTSDSRWALYDALMGRR